MARQMIEANTALFNKFRRRYAKFQNDAVPRFVVSNEEEKHWLRHVEFESPQELEFSEFQSAHLCRIDGDVFLLTKNIEAIEDSSIAAAPMNGGLFVAAVRDLPINIRLGATETEIEEIPMRELADGDKRAGFEHHEITPFFDDLKFYKIPAGSQLMENGYGHRIALLLALTPATQLCRLRLREISLDLFHLALHDDVENFPLSLLFQATQERRWDIAFLNIYKSLEQLFPIFKIEDFRDGYDNHISTDNEKSIIPLQMKLFDLASLAENHLGWRAHEEDAMQRLFSKLPESLIDEFCHYLGVESADFERKVRKVAESIYKIRNCTVHFRPGNITQQKDVFPVDDDYWESVLCTLLKTTFTLYRQYGRELRVFAI
jgi:hypothetical protein